MAIYTPQEMFRYGLREALGMEHQLADLLPELAQAAQNDPLKKLLQEDAEEGQAQARRLDNCLNRLCTQPMPLTCEGVQGLKREFEGFNRQQPSPQLLDAFIIGAAFKADYYEIATYLGLIERSMLMGQHQITQLLEQTLEEEQEGARRLQKLFQRVSKQMLQQCAGLRA